MKKLILLFLMVSFIFLMTNCKKETIPPTVTYNPTFIKIPVPSGFPRMIIPADNPTTAEGIELGRMLFYDSIIDIGNQRSCGKCHQQKFSFSSSENSLSHINLAWNIAFLWKGDVEGSLEDIMLFEVEQFFQTDVNKVNANSPYRSEFIKAFNVTTITSREIAYALAQFTRSLISCNSRYDKFLRGELILSEEELSGRSIYYSERGDCFHCHGTILLTDNYFRNNGLDSIPVQGRSEITGKQKDWGKFKTPTLRNIELTAPYMHDGRFKTLEEVVNFYSEQVKWSPTIDPMMKKVLKGGVHLNPKEKSDLISFLRTFTDTTFIDNPEFSNPF